MKTNLASGKSEDGLSVIVEALSSVGMRLDCILAELTTHHAGNERDARTLIQAGNRLQAALSIVDKQKKKLRALVNYSHE